jgi:serine/threonine protein kinase/tetratricopeptide (TPR) repeat protein
MSIDPKLVRDHFLAAAELSAIERADYLRERCQGDTQLQAAVERLLAAHDLPASILDRPTIVSLGQTDPQATGEQPGVIILGRYKLLEEIGAGGMGSVWMAEQLEPVRRKVALKLIKAGMDSKSVLARFDAERQALALMDHPNIAKVLDGGLTESGRPFFVMEYFKGVPITEYCDAARLGIPERLHLFTQVCQAVQHAHQKGIIHRDLKPSNILVAPYDDKPVPKVIDFGLAKATHQSLTDQTLHTAHEAVLGTPLYMSPEQAQLNNLDVDTRSDIYSLGVLLYELLTGTTPLEKQRFKKAAWEEVRRIIREEDPPSPSARLGSSPTLPSLAAVRQMEPGRLPKLVRGELDWIVMKAMEKERSRRYETTNGFATDILRYLAGEPVLAAPPRAAYRLRKFVRKHRTMLGVTTAFFLILTGGILISSWLAWRATIVQRELQVALAAAEAARAEEIAQRQRAEANGKKAREAEARAKAVSQFLQDDLLRQADSHQQADRSAEANPNLTVREVLERAAINLSRFGPGQELVEAELRLTIGEAFQGIGLARRAVPHLERARDIRVEQLGPDQEATLRAIRQLALAYYSADRLAEARNMLRELYPRVEAKLGKNHPLTIACLCDLGFVNMKLSAPAESIAMNEEALNRARSVLGPEHADTLSVMTSLGTLYDRAGRRQEALALYEELLRLRRSKQGPTHPDTQTALNNLGTLYWRLGKLELSIPLFEEALRLRKQIMGESHPLTVRTQTNLGINYLDANRVQEAIPLLESALEHGRPFAGAEGVNVLAILDTLAEAYTKLGQHAKAQPLFLELYETTRRESGDGHTSPASWQARLGLNLLQQKKYTEAEPHLRAALEVRTKREPDAWTTFNTTSLVGGALLGQKRYADAEPLLMSGYEGMKKRATKIPPQAKQRLIEAVDRLIELADATKKPHEAKRWRDERVNYASRDTTSVK